jgi:hypothetical protein
VANRAFGYHLPEEAEQCGSARSQNIQEIAFNALGWGVCSGRIESDFP